MLRYVRGRPRSTPRRALFLDRDGILNRRIPDGYVVHPQEFEPIPLALRSARSAQSADAALVVVTNQGAIARNRATESQILGIHGQLLTWLSGAGVHLDGIYTCPHHPQSEDVDRRECECRKPKPGLLLAAAQDLSLDLSTSMMIGDQPSDIAAALAAGIAEENALLVGEADEAWLTNAVSNWANRTP